MGRSVIKDRFQHLDQIRGDMHTRHEQYARWTVPSIYPPDHNENNSQGVLPHSNVEIGARIVNHLAHRIVDTMYPNDRAFFSVSLSTKAETKVYEELGPDAADFLVMAQEGMTRIENHAMRNMDLTEYRPQAVRALIMNIVTGNALIVRHTDPSTGAISRVVYSTRDYVVKRNLLGTERLVIFRDLKSFGELSEEHKALYRAKHPMAKDEDEDYLIELYTKHEFRDNRWHWSQALDDVDLPETGAHTVDDWPCIVLVWDIGRGDDYGRGLVELYTTVFHNLDVLTEAKMDLIGIAADVKFMVDEASGFDVQSYNDAKRGEYVAGKKDAISVPNFKFAVELNIIVQDIERKERGLSQAFLMQSGGVRDAERVTAEEIRFFAREIEAAFGGLYARLSLGWQKREALYLLSKMDLSRYLGDEGLGDLDTTVTSGLESLSREGKLDRLTRAIQDMTGMDAIPEEIRAALHPLKFAAYIFRNRNVPAEEFLRTPEEMQAMQDREQKQQQDLLKQQGEQAAAQEAMRTA